MITLYDLVFDQDLRPSPFCWRAKLALKHKGLAWRDEPCGFTEKHKIAFAQSQTYPVIHDGTKVVKDSWVIAQHLDAAYPDKPLLPDRSYAQFVNAKRMIHGYTYSDFAALNDGDAVKVDCKTVEARMNAAKAIMKDATKVAEKASDGR